MSVLRKAAHEYLQVRRALGYKLEAQGHLLLQFVEYLEQRGALVITTELALKWARQPADASQLWWHQRLSVVRGFARYLVGLDPRTEVPANDLLPARSRRAVPCLYSEAEIAAADASGPRAPNPTEGRHVRDADRVAVRDRDAASVRRSGSTATTSTWTANGSSIRRAKNERSRGGATAPKHVQALRAYALLRDELCTRPLSQSFLATSTGGAASSPHDLARVR